MDADESVYFRLPVGKILDEAGIRLPGGIAKFVGFEPSSHPEWIYTGWMEALRSGRNGTPDNLIIFDIDNRNRQFRQTMPSKGCTRIVWRIPDDVYLLLERREDARTAKDYAKADDIRRSLDAAGIVVQDGKGWYPKLWKGEESAIKLADSWYVAQMNGTGMAEDAKDAAEYAKRRREQMRDWW